MHGEALVANPSVSVFPEASVSGEVAVFSRPMFRFGGDTLLAIKTLLRLLLQPVFLHFETKLPAVAM